MSRRVNENLFDCLRPLHSALTAGSTVAIARSTSSAEAWIAAGLSIHSPTRTILWVLDGPQSLTDAFSDLEVVSRDLDIERLLFPALETMAAGKLTPHPDTMGRRLHTLLSLMGASRTPRRIVITCVQALLQKTISPRLLKTGARQLSTGDEWETSELVRHCLDSGYRPESEVIEPATIAVRGGIVDIWCPASPWPVRMEFFGSRLESLREFDPSDQRSVRPIASLSLLPAREWKSAAEARHSGESLFSFLSGGLTAIFSDRERIDEHAELYWKAAESATESSGTSLSPSDLGTLLRSRADTSRLYTTHEQVLPSLSGLPSFLPVDPPPDTPGFSTPDAQSVTRKKMFEALRHRASSGETVRIFFDTPGAMEHFRADIAGLDTSVGRLSAGFRSPDARITVVAESDLYGRRRVMLPSRPAIARRTAAIAGERLTDMGHIEPGDLVVHEQYGIGRNMGLREIVVDGRRQEVLTLEYADGARLHVPAAHMHLLSRYVGMSGHRVTLHRLGGRRWQTEKSAAETAIRDMAAAMLETQARRNILKGHAFPPDTPWQREMEATFPYTETEDQVRVIAEVKRDMESPRPMDRLICGDAGYGKTEVAVRAAFKAVMDHRQVAVLVPTTILAQQHYDTFSERMSQYPVRVEMLSRFVSDSRHRAAVAGLADGSVDVIIGTHALLEPGIHFKDLGLLIVDEEQRFGVIHKEQIKHIRELVDVLTMTATPIPRTLYMSLTGARDMSLLQTPPSERVAVETIVSRNTDEEVRAAIMREINREGQVFYLHNRVETIGRVAERLRRLVPEARLDIAHGQMAAGELAIVMKNFRRGAVDILVCTTIIESGMDLPRANTILIDRADRFGIADLYQLRGRVGRAGIKAYAYLLLPVDARVAADARKRISTVQRYSYLSAGFQLALRDLEIRGSGNLLGTAQSGHIAAVGFALYCQLLRRTVARLQSRKLPMLVDVDVKIDDLQLSESSPDPDAGAVIPSSYMEEERLRIDTYRRLAEVASAADIRRLAQDCEDRFGKLPPEVLRLLKVAQLRVEAATQGITTVEISERKLMVTRNGELVTSNGRFPRVRGDTVDARLDDAIRMIRRIDAWNETKLR